MARPSKLTPEVQERIASLLRAGNTVEIASQAAGISPETYYAWMNRGLTDKPADKPYREFRSAVETARAESEAVLVTRIAKAAANGSWTAAAWLLERRNPAQWAKASERRALAEQDDSEAVDPFAALDELAPRRQARGANGA